MLIRSEEEKIPIQDQLEKIADQHPKQEAVIFSHENLTVETDPALPEAELIAQKIAELIEDPSSFINSKANEIMPESIRAWENEIAWKLYPSSEMRASGLSSEIQTSRQKKVEEALNNNQPLELDLGILWVGEINSEKLTINDLAIVKNIVGLMNIISEYQKKDQDIKANFRIKIAVEPSLTSQISEDEIQKYIQNLSQLSKTLISQSKIDQESIKLEIDIVETKNEQVSLEELTNQITEFWQESEASFDQKAKELGFETWKEIPLSNWVIDATTDVDTDPKHYYNKFIKVFTEETLQNLESYKNLPNNIKTLLLPLTPNFKEALLHEVLIFSGQMSESEIKNSEMTYSELLAKKELVVMAINSLTVKIKTILENENPEATLEYQFGSDLPDSPENNKARLRHLGNLSFNKPSPWRSKFSIHRTTPSDPSLTVVKEKLIRKSATSTPETYGLKLMPAVFNPTAIDSVAIVTIGETKIEVPIHYLMSDWLGSFVKHILKGKKQ